MTCQQLFLLLFVIISCCGVAVGQDDLEIPDPKVEALYPKGFRVSIPNDGYSFFGFRGNINKEFRVLNEGDIKADIPRPKGKQYVYTNRSAKLKVGDIIYYWIVVIKNGNVQMKTDLAHTVTGFVNEDGTPASGQTPSGPSPSPAPNQPSTSSSDDSIYFPKYGESDSSCTISKTEVQGVPSVCQGSVIFNEEFVQTSLREMNKWYAEVKFPGEPDFPFNLYDPEQTVSFEEGALVITPRLTESVYREGFLHESLDLSDRCTGKANTQECSREAFGAQILPPVVTAKISTRRNFNFKFGKIEVRAKLPSGSWLIPEINLEPTDFAYGPNGYESGLMRIAYVRGNPTQAKKLYAGPILTDKDPFRSLLMKEKIGIDNWHRNFHNYSLIWKPDGIDLLVDGEQYGSINPGEGFYQEAKNHNIAHAHNWLKGTVMAPLDQMFHLTLGLRVGGVNDFPDDMPDKPWKNRASKAVLDFWNKKETWHPSWHDSSLRIEYVRVYAL